MVLNRSKLLVVHAPSEEVFSKTNNFLLNNFYLLTKHSAIVRKL